MKKLWYLLLITTVSGLVFAGQSPATTSESSLMEVLAFKWAKRRQPAERTDVFIAERRVLVDANAKRVARNTPGNRTTADRDPGNYTVEIRSAEMEKTMQEINAPRPIDGYGYRVKLQNLSTKAVDKVVWEYQFIDPASNGSPSRRQFLCAVKIGPDKIKEIEAFSVSGPGHVVSVKSAAGAPANPFQEKAVINRVQYSDGTIWSRKDWNFEEVKQTFARAVEIPWGQEMCRQL